MSINMVELIEFLTQGFAEPIISIKLIEYKQLLQIYAAQALPEADFCLGLQKNSAKICN